MSGQTKIEGYPEARVGTALGDTFTGLEITPYGTKMWFKDGHLHCADGPAVIYCDERSPEWAINGAFIHSYEKFQALTKCDDSVIILLRLKYGNIVNDYA